MFDYIGYLLYFVFYGCLDTYTTIKGIRMGATEANPIVRYIINKTGFNGFVCVKGFLVLLGLFAFTDYKFIVVFSGIVVINNIYQLKIKRCY